MSNRTDVSIGLETFGTGQDAYVLSIGAAKFDIHTGEILDGLHIKTVCDPNKYRLDIDTIFWWMNQGNVARSNIISGNRLPIIEALTELSSFIDRKDYVWGNGATFDISILEHAYETEIGKIPWKFWNARDMRTLIDIAEAKGFDKKSIKRNGIHHSALDDAVYQAQVMANAWHYIENGSYL